MKSPQASSPQGKWHLPHHQGSSDLKKNCVCSPYPKQQHAIRVSLPNQQPDTMHTIIAFPSTALCDALLPSAPPPTQNNQELLYALLQRQELLSPYRQHPRLGELVDNLQVRPAYSHPECGTDCEGCLGCRPSRPRASGSGRERQIAGPGVFHKQKLLALGVVAAGGVRHAPAHLSDHHLRLCKPLQNVPLLAFFQPVDH